MKISKANIWKILHFSALVFLYSATIFKVKTDSVFKRHGKYWSDAITTCSDCLNPLSCSRQKTCEISKAVEVPNKVLLFG